MIFIFEVDDNLIENLLIAKLITKFNMVSKIYEYSQSPNSSVDIKENSLTFTKWNDRETILEDFRVIMYYGVSGMQYSQKDDRVIVNLRSFPDGSANWDRNVVIHAQKMSEGYQITIMVITSEELAKLENIKSATYQKLDLASLKDCLAMVEEEVDPTSYMLFQDHLNTLEPLFARDLDPQQLTFASLDTSKHSPSSEIN